jgi:hypothetical protein
LDSQASIRAGAPDKESGSNSWGMAKKQKRLLFDQVSRQPASRIGGNMVFDDIDW